MFGCDDGRGRRGLGDMGHSAVAKGLAALCQGRSPEEIRALGEQMDPHEPVMCSRRVKYFGDPGAWASVQMPAAALAARLGLGDLALGMARSDLFWERGYADENRIQKEHDNKPLAAAVLCEALRNGDLGLAKEITQAAQDAAQRLSGRRAQFELELGVQWTGWRGELGAPFFWLGLAEGRISAKAYKESLEWLLSQALSGAKPGREEEDLRQRTLDAFLSQCCSEGRSQGARAAMDLGAKPSRSCMLELLGNGQEEMARACAQAGREGRGRDERGSGEKDSKAACKDSVAAAGRMWRFALERIAQGAWEDRDPRYGREVFWADYCDRGARLLEMATDLFRGAYEWPGDVPDKEGRLLAAQAASVFCLRAPDPAQAWESFSKLSGPVPVGAQEALCLMRLDSEGMPYLRLRLKDGADAGWEKGVKAAIEGWKQNADPRRGSDERAAKRRSEDSLLGAFLLAQAAAGAGGAAAEAAKSIFAQEGLEQRWEKHLLDACASGPNAAPRRSFNP